MAKDPRTNSENHIAIPVPSSEEATSATYLALVEVINLINGGLSLGSGENQTFAGNLKGVYVDVLTPGTPDQEFTVYHNLGYIPQNFIVTRLDRAAIIYVSNTQAPDTKTATLQCSVADVTAKIWIF